MTTPLLLSAATTSPDGALVLPDLEYVAIFPAALLVVGALLLLLLSSVVKERIDAATGTVFTVVVGSVAMAGAYWLWQDVGDVGPYQAFAGAIAADRFTAFFVVTIGSAVILGALLLGDWMHRTRTDGPEPFVLLMLSAAGGMVMAAANDLIVVFLGLEILSIALYVLTGLDRRSERSREAAMKYFLLGGFSSAIFLYGVALTYGATGTTNLTGISNFLARNTLVDNGLLLAGLALLLVGFGFKVAAAPFHQWTPDVYQGAPTPVTAFMAAASKAAAFAALLRVFGGTFTSVRLDWRPVVLVLAVLTLLVGSIVACVQRDVKRMLAYSSVSHAGFVLLGLYVATADGLSGSAYYLLAYTFMALGSFAIVGVVEASGSGVSAGRVVGSDEAIDQDREMSEAPSIASGATSVATRAVATAAHSVTHTDHDEPDRRTSLDAFHGLGHRRPGLALAFAVLLLAQAGLPLTSGFLAKFAVISAVVQDGDYALAVFAMLAAAVAAYFYLRIIVTMYGSPAGDDSVAADDRQVAVQGNGGGPAVASMVSGQVVPAATWIVIAVALLFTVGLGIAPPAVIDAVAFARQAVSDLFPTATSTGAPGLPSG